MLARVDYPCVMTDGELAQVLRRLIDLAKLAESPNEHEAANAALKVCQIVRDHRDRIRIDGIERPSRGSVHPLTLLFTTRGIRPSKADEAKWCLCCGEVIDRGAAVAVHYRAGATHYACRGWWTDFDFSSLPPEEPDDMPF